MEPARYKALEAKFVVLCERYRRCHNLEKRAAIIKKAREVLIEAEHVVLGQQRELTELGAEKLLRL